MHFLTPLAAVAPLLVTPQEAGDRPALATLLPPDPLVVVLAEDLDALQARLRSSAWWSLLQDPEMVRLHAALQATEAYRARTEALGGDPLQVLARAAAAVDELALVLEAPRGLDGDLRTTLVLRHALDPEATALVDRALDDLQAELSVRERDDLAGAQLYVGDGRALFRAPGLFVLEVGADGAQEEADAARSAREARVLELATRARGARAAEGSTESFAAAQAYTGSRGDADLPLEAFVDLGRLMEGLTYDSDLPEEFVPMLEDMGLTRMGHLHAAADVGAGERFDVLLRADVGQGSVFERLLRLGGGIDVDLLDHVPADALSVASTAYDLAGLYDATQAMVDEYDPSGQARSGLDLGQMMIEAELGYGIEELVEMFTGQITTFSATVASDDEALAGLEALTDVDFEGLVGDCYVVGLHDAEQLSYVLTDVLAAAGDMTPRPVGTIGGVELLTVDTGTASTLAYALTDDVAYFSGFPSLVRRALELRTAEGAATAADAEGFAGFAALASGAVSASMTDTAGVIEQLLFLGRNFAGLMFDDPRVAELLDSLPMPDPSIAKAYFGGRATSRVALVGSRLEVVTSSR